MTSHADGPTLQIPVFGLLVLQPESKYERASPLTNQLPLEAFLNYCKGILIFPTFQLHLSLWIW